jgi:hypothetical protein
MEPECAGVKQRFLPVSGENSDQDETWEKGDGR